MDKIVLSMSYSQAATEALNVIFTPEGIVLILLGSLLGLLFGVLPGLGGAVGIALLIPLTFDLDPLTAFMILTAANGGAAFGGSVTAILLNIPGTAVNAATLLDGYPMAKKGEANVALGASAAASAGGAIIGLVVLLLSLPVLRSILRLFGPPEFFAMAIFGLIIIAYVDRQSLLNGLIAGFIGMGLGLVGFNQITGGRRYTFDTIYLQDGVELLGVIIGLFAVGEMLHLLMNKQTISSRGIQTGGNALDGVRAVITHRGIFVRSSIVGVIVGLVPAAGGTTANFIGYVQAMQTSKNPERFGTGDIRGIIASESANDSKDGGAMIPTISFGIPGSAAWAVMLGAFTLHGIVPGPSFLEDNLDVIFMMLFALLISNITTSIVGILFANNLARLTNVPIKVLAPSILVLSFVGAYTLRFDILDVVFAGIFGLVGLLMIHYNFSRIALIIGLVLGPMAEESLAQSLQISRGSYAIFYTRPITVLLFLLIIVVLMAPYIQALRE